MATPQRRLSREDLAQRGTELYESEIRGKVEEGNRGKVVAIDVETGDFELAQSALSASDRLLARLPDAQTWFVRIGHQALHRLGPRLLAEGR